MLVAAACGGGGSPTHVSARVYLLRGGKVAPVARTVSAIEPDDLLKALRAGPTSAERAAGLTSRFGLAQIVYTLSQQAPSRAVAYKGHSYTRADFEDETPIILVENPLPFAHVRTPLRATGTANTFEATFDYDLLGANGRVLAHHFVTATSGTGQRGTFAFTARFTVPHAEQGRLVVYEESAKDGSRIHQSEIPLTLEP